MRVDIVIPTYLNHLRQNLEFMASVDVFCAPDSSPFIHIIVGIPEESQMLKRGLALFSPALREKVQIVELTKELLLFKERCEADTDSEAAWKTYPKYPLINFKKLSGVETAFRAGADVAVVLDSEIAMFRPARLHDVLAARATDNKYVYSKAAMKSDIMRTIQHDSLRSLQPDYDRDHYLARGYGWFDNLCFYRKEYFPGFLKALGGGDTILDIIPGLRGCAFEWIMYNAYEILQAGREVVPIDIDRVIQEATGRAELFEHPQTEMIYLYVTGDPAKDGQMLSKLDLPWVPASDDPYILDLLLKHTPDSCCLMFHKDRQHDGQRAKTP